MIPPRIAILADDLTGAADTAAGMLAAGRPWVTWQRSNGSLAWHDDDRIVAIDAGTRQASAADAGKSVRDLAALCRTAGFAHIYKKIDSTLRGNVAAELAAFRAATASAAGSFNARARSKDCLARLSLPACAYTRPRW